MKNYYIDIFKSIAIDDLKIGWSKAQLSKKPNALFAFIGNFLNKNNLFHENSMLHFIIEQTGCSKHSVGLSIELFLAIFKSHTGLPIQAVTNDLYLDGLHIGTIKTCYRFKKSLSHIAFALYNDESKKIIGLKSFNLDEKTTAISCMQSFCSSFQNAQNISTLS